MVQAIGVRAVPRSRAWKGWSAIGGVAGQRAGDDPGRDRFMTKLKRVPRYEREQANQAGDNEEKVAV